MTNITNPINRRQAIAGAGAAGALAITGPALASVPKSDAELIRLGVEFERLYAEWLPVLKEWQRLHEVAYEAWRAKNIPLDTEALFAIQDETGSTAASYKNDAALDSLEAVAKKIRELPASGRPLFPPQKKGRHDAKTHGRSPYAGHPGNHASRQLKTGPRTS